MTLLEARRELEQLQYPLDFNPDDWDDCVGGTCVNYVYNLACKKQLLIGDLINKRVTYHDSWEDIVATFTEEARALGFLVEECDPNYPLEDGAYKVFLILDRHGFYHLLRQDSDEGWSHKKAGKLPDHTDWRTGWEIYDPIYTYGRDSETICFLLSIW